MSIFAVLTTLSLVALSQSSTTCAPSWKWAFNSMGQDPCTIMGVLYTPCNQGGMPHLPVLPSGGSYSGPSAGDANTCKCNTVVYSLLSACGACQGGSWISWSDYIPNCTSSNFATPYALAIPSGTSVPYWALINVTVKGTWDPDESRAVGDTPESGPGAVITTPASSPVLSSSAILSYSPTATSSSKSTGSSNVGVIAGGVIGGIAVISAATLIGFFWIRSKHRQGSPTAAVFDPTPQPLMDEFRPQSSESRPFVPPSLPETRVPPMRIYDPEDPTTFPSYQGPDPVPEAHTKVPAV
ncbi:hypothetical protein BGW80DRAFT_286690 [Lactifluus volemus]|nr:hypothetical protein BGW80DRAFT_286690 [Lactifluus volemus]